ncbi:PLD nuclease N-terminal domain-containing protein [Paenibacillus sp. 1P07SE]|uniref:PLD nuclease N-terminal domain-containing protein n=1 Tax=Paenibacillus sp. 1P07SE TaxID=3132209 RepID=UPI0039A4546F
MKINTVSYEELMNWLPLLIPLVLLQLILIAIALRDLIPSTRPKEQKWLWGIVICCVTLLGPIAYLVAGRKGY